MSLLIVGLNHTTASIGLRERVAFAPEQLGPALAQACAIEGVGEAVLLSTCNRTELVVQTEGGAEVAPRLRDWLAASRHLDPAELEGCLYRHQDEAALDHLIRVASGLDSMVMGEPQIFGQLKSAYHSARASGTVGAALGRAFDHAFAIAKRVRTETAIGQNPVSVAFAAVRLARHIFDDFGRTTALLIGAGEMVELLARHLREAGVPRLIIANRTLPRAERLAAVYGGEAILLAQIPDHLSRADIVMSCTAAQLPILGKGTVEQAMRARRRKPVFMVDIAVPRDIEPQVAELSDVYLYGIDDLEQIVDDNRRAREQEAARAGDIVASGVEEWRRSLRGRDAVATLRDYRDSAERLRDIETERALRQLRGGAEPEQVLAQLGRNLTNKLVHGPSVALRRAGEEGRHDLLDAARRLFGLDENQTGDGGGGGA
jgi:glutamyl-tRNA reductase